MSETAPTSAPVADGFDWGLINSGRPPGFATGWGIKLSYFRKLFKLPDDAPIDMSQIKLEICDDRLWVTLAQEKTSTAAEAIAA